ncbi:costars family protein ABRACL-like isoform X1 [Physella acuta]|uniref:costars family protein ABRACL-like isoform X1 n=2 Tax=Physella acuta TaxID=109671 RepID=UPI0027DD1CA5|nr:costars family protein ABRACL-like isoform X1 [Physella acuta]
MSHDMEHRVKMNVEHEIQLLVGEINRLGTEGADGKVQVTFGTLFNDEKCANIFEALVGTLRAAKRKKIISYEGELLLQGVHDKVVISIL